MNAVPSELIRQTDSLASLTEDHIAALVRAGTLQAEEGERLSLTASLYRIAGAHVPLVTALGTERFAVLGERPVTALRDLAALTAADGERLVTSTAMRVDEGADARTTAARLERTMASMFPTGALRARVGAASRGVAVRWNMPAFSRGGYFASAASFGSVPQPGRSGRIR